LNRGQSIFAHSRSFLPARLLPLYFQILYLTIGKKNRENTLSSVPVANSMNNPGYPVYYYTMLILLM